MSRKKFEQDLVQYVAKRLELVDRRKGYPKKYMISCLIGQEHELLKIIIDFKLDVAYKQEKYAYFYRNGKVIHKRNIKKRR